MHCILLKRCCSGVKKLPEGGSLNFIAQDQGYGLLAQLQLASEVVTEISRCT